MTATAPTAPDFSAVLSRFAGLAPAGDGRWSARCPVHEDRRNSLGLWLGRNGKLIVGCHAGCDKRVILQAVGLTFKDLAGDQPTVSGFNGRKIAKTYDYRDELGELLYQTVRYEPKDFRQRQPDGNGWRWTIDGARRVLYRLPDLLKARRSSEWVYVVEGEKDADNLWALGLPATTRVCGARSPWQADWSSLLADRHIVIIPDRDQAGELSAATIAGALVVSGCPASVRVLRLPGGGKDVSDWIANVRRAESAAWVATALTRIAKTAPGYSRFEA